MACVGRANGTEADKLQEPLSSEEMILKYPAVFESDATEPGIVTQSAKCSDSVSASTSASKLVVDTVTVEKPSGSSNAVNDLCTGNGCVSCDSSMEVLTSEPSVYEGIASLASDRQPVYAIDNITVDSVVGDCSERTVTAAGPNAELDSSHLHSQSNSSLDEVKCSHDAEKCRSNSSITAPSHNCSTQSSIRSFFKPLSKKQPTETAVHCVKNVGQPASSLAPQNCAMLMSHTYQTGANNAISCQNSSVTDKTRKCPFYKWVSGMISYSSCF